MSEPTYSHGVCSECGAGIFIAERELHNEWHAKMDELIDWAQSVSKLFTPPSSPQERAWEPGDPIE